MTHITRRLLSATALGLVAAPALAPTQAQAQGRAWPERPVRLIVPFPAGGPNDVIARVLGQRLTAALGQPVVVENRSGGGGVLGTDAVAKAAADGYTFAVTSAGALAISPVLMEACPYVVERDLAAVTLVAKVPELLAVNPKLPVRTLAELVAYAKAHPGDLNFASSGNGSVPHLAGESLRFAAGIDITHVPYRGAAPAVTDLIGGQVQMMFADMPVLLPQVQSGALRAIALGSPRRSTLLPEVPTTGEAGLPQVQAENWYGMVAPAATPAPILARLREATLAALTDAAVVKTLREQGAEAAGGGADAFSAFIRAESAKWGDVGRRSGTRMD